MTKTISLADDAYDALVAVKQSKESFSQLARRLARQEAQRHLFDRTRKPLFTKEQAEEMKRNVRKWRDESLGKRRGWDEALGKRRGGDDSFGKRRGADA